MGILTDSSKQEVDDAVNKANENAEAFKNGDQWTSYDDFTNDIETQKSEITSLRDDFIKKRDQFEEGSDKWKQFDEQVQKLDGALETLNGSFLTEAEFVNKQNANRVKDLYEKPADKYGAATWGAALKQYLTNGFGNTTLGGRGTLKWNKDNLNNQNFENAQSWGWNKKQLRNTRSTYMADVLDSGDLGDKPGQYALTVTPMFQGKNGPEVLSKDLVTQYMQSLLDQSTEDGVVDWGKMFDLDNDPEATGLITASGEKIHGLLMGAFEGEGSLDAAGALGELEHLLSSEGLQATDTSASGLKTLAQDANALGESLANAGSQGKQTADAMKVAFLDLNQDALRNLNTDELSGVLSSLDITEDKLNEIQGQHPEIQITTKADNKELDETDKTIKNVEGEHTATVTVKAETDEKTVNPKNLLNGGFVGATSGKEVPLPLTVDPAINNPDAFSADNLKDEANIPDKIDIGSIKVIANLKPAQISAGSLKKGIKSQAKKETSGIEVNQTQDSTVNYTLGKQDDPKPKKTDVNYNLGKQDDPKSKTANVDYTLGGQDDPKDKHAKVIYDEAYKGKNNYIQHQAPLQFNSLAVGNVKNKKNTAANIGEGLTLTGEKGYEVAWLPSQNKSMILGSNGPQMINLPKDAVVWDHKQSERILKQKAIPAKSFSGGSVSGSTGNLGGNTSGGRNRRIISGGSNGSHSGGSGGDGGKQAKKNQKKQAKILQKAGKINAWWWNMTKRVEATQRKIDQLNKKIEKTIDKIGTTLSSISGEATEYIKKLKQQIDLNTKMLNKADKKLGILSGERTSKKTKDAKKAVKEDKKRLKKARKTDSKQDDKKAKKRLKKDQKELKKSQKGVNWARISYDVIKKKGKKKTKKSKKKRINLSPYIYLDPDTGAYNVDYDKINEEIGLDHRNKKGKKVKGNKSKAKATMEAAEKKIEKYQDRHNTAEDNIDKAQEALDELGQKLYETFFAWENELTKIWNVTQKIAEAESKRGRAESFSELLDAQVADGTISSKNELLGQDYFDKINTAFTKGINEQISSINLTRESIDLKKANLQDLLNGETERKTLENVKDIIDYSSAYGEWEDLAADTQKAIKQTNKKIKNAEDDKADAKKAIKKDNKIINGKKSSKKEKKEARQDRKEARQDKKEATATINAYTELKDSLGNTLAAANQEMQNILNAGYKELDAGELLAYQTEKTALEDQLKIIEAANAYMRPEIKDDGTISVNFNTEDFERDKQSGLLNSTTAEKIQEYVKKIVDETQDLHDTYKDLTEKITELHSTLADLQDAWVGYSEDLMSYLEDAQEVDIEKYKSLSDSIRDALEKLLDQVKKNLEERRKQEDNAKTERDISQKQQRLAALRADTSGGHQVEIAQLEKEIADAQTDYGRNLEDQLLDRLNDQADAAAEQRERIIELEEAINSAVNNAETVNKWMENPSQFKEEIRAAVYKAKDYQNLTKAQQEQVDRQTDQLLVGLETNPKKTEEVKNAINQMTALVEFLEGTLNDVGDNVEANKDNTDSIDDKVATVIEGLRGNIDAVTGAVKDVNETLKDNETAEVQRQTDATASAQAADTAKKESAYKLAVANAKSNGTITANQFNKAINAGAALNKSADQVVQDLKTSQLTWKEILTAAHDAGWGPKKIKDLNRNASKDSAFRKAWESIFPNKKWSEYATGGLASYTGPAWLDGTPSKPELVLNSADTKNFIALRDVLSKAVGNIDNSNETLTNAMYEININVDHINNDYDVDKIAARIKKDIVKDAGYRNVTQVRNLR